MPLGFYTEQDFSHELSLDIHDSDETCCYVVPIYSAGLPLLIMWEILEIVLNWGVLKSLFKWFSDPRDEKITACMFPKAKAEGETVKLMSNCTNYKKCFDDFQPGHKDFAANGWSLKKKPYCGKEGEIIQIYEDNSVTL